MHDQVCDLYNGVCLNGGGSGSSFNASLLSRLVYSPAIPSPSLGVYNDFNALYEDFLLTHGLIEIHLDHRYGLDSAGFPSVPSESLVFPVPAPSLWPEYDFQGRASFLSKISSFSNVLYFGEEGTVIRRCLGLNGAVLAANETSSPVFRVGEYQEWQPEVFAIERGASLAGITAPVIRVAEGASASPQSVLALLNGSIFNGGSEAVEIAPSGACILFLGENARIEQDTILDDGTTAIIALVSSPSEGINDLLSGNQANFFGFLLSQYDAPSRQVSYLANNAGDWGSSVPANVAEALDTLAANTVIP